MTRQQIYDMATEAITNGDYKCIHAVDRDGAKNIIVTFDRDLLAFINEDGTAQIIAKGNAHMFTNIKRQQLLDLSIEGQEAAAERRRLEEEKARLQEIEDMKEKLPKWREQHAVLEQKIREAEQLTGEPHGVREQDECPSQDEPKKKWYEKVFSSKP